MSNLRVEVSPEAEIDLIEIWRFVAIDNPVAADRLLDVINAQAQQLLRMPLSGRERAELRPELRSVAVGSYVLYYVPTLFGIRVFRVLHGARDAAAEFRRL